MSYSNGIKLNKEDEFGRSLISNRNNNGPRTDPCVTPRLIEEEEVAIPKKIEDLLAQKKNDIRLIWGQISQS